MLYHPVTHHHYTIQTPLPTDPHDNRPSSILKPIINVGIGDESSEYLEARIREYTGEAVKADKDWTRLSGELSIDVSVVAGFMFQSDAADDGIIQLVDDECLPVQILIRRDQDFGMYLVTTLHEEQWTTSGNFHLRFVRRVPVLDKPCATPKEGTSGGSCSPLSDVGSSSTGEPESSTNGAESARDGDEEQNADDQTEGISSHSDDDKENWPPDEDLMEEEDDRGSGAAALRGVGGGMDPPGRLLPPWF